METAGKTRKKADELLPEMPAGPVASEVRRPALLKPVEPLPNVRSINGSPVPVLVKINEVIDRINRLIEAENERGRE